MRNTSHDLEPYHSDNLQNIIPMTLLLFRRNGILLLIDGNGRIGRLLVNLELMKAGYPPINIKFADRLAYYNALDDYYVKHNISAMEKLFVGDVNEQLDMYLAILQD